MIRRISQWTILFITLACVSGLVFNIRQAIEARAARPAPPNKTQTPPPDVSVISAATGSYHALISGYGSVSPHFELTLSAQVKGQIQTLSKGFETGERIKKGALLVRLDGTNYQAAVSTAQRTLSDARLALLEEERQAMQAAAEWKSSGMTGDPASELVLRKPQLAAAKAAVTEAKSALKSARKDLEKTRITAPFDALVVERLVAPGGFVQAGTAIATLYSTDRVEIALALSASDWADLPGSELLLSGTWPVELQDAQTGQSWRGYVLRCQRHLDAQSRQRSLILAVDSPLDARAPLLPGGFVKARIKGKKVAGLWKLPASAFSQKGEIWYVTKEHTLASFSADPLFSDNESVYVSPPKALADQPQSVLVHPLNAYLKGMRVNPVEESGHES